MAGCDSLGRMSAGSWSACRSRASTPACCQAVRLCAACVLRACACVCMQLEQHLYEAMVPGYEAWGTALCAGTNFIVRADTLQARSPPATWSSLAVN